MKCANPSTLITDSIRSCYGMADSVIVIWRRTQPPVGALQEVQCKKQHSQSSAPQQQVGLPQLRSRKRVIARPGRKTGNRGVAQLGRAPEKHQRPPLEQVQEAAGSNPVTSTMGHAQKARCRWWGSLGTPVSTHNSTGAHPLKLGGQVVSARYYREDLYRTMMF